MTDLLTSEEVTVIPSRRAQVMSAVRATLHTAVVVALLLSILKIDGAIAVPVGLMLGVIAATRSRRIGMYFTATGVVVNNYFRTYSVEPLRGATLHFYLRNRVEIESNERSIHVQAATFFDADQRDEIEALTKDRGGKVEHLALGG